MKFELATPTRILFGEGRVAEAGGLAAQLGARALLVEGGSGRGGVLLEPLRAAGVPATRLTVEAEPSVGMIEEGVRLARDAGCDVVIAIGGGSVIDAGKAVAAMLTNPGELRDYLEVVGRGVALAARSAPMIAIPTTAGTGAEVTRNAVLLAEAERVKVSLRSALMIPTVALVDPELTRSLPPEATASTGLDALTQCIEPFVTPQANPITDALAREGMRRAATALPRAFRDGSDRAARADMAVASLCGGLALANAKLGAVHGFAAPLGGMFPVPHGVACARLLPPVVEANVRALRERAPGSAALERYREVARLLTGTPDAEPEAAVEWLRSLASELAVPPLSSYGIGPADVTGVVEKARGASSMQGNPIVLTEAELGSVLTAAL